MSRKYDEEFKKKLVKMVVVDGRRREYVAKDYGISPPLLGYWMKKYKEEVTKQQS